MSTFLHLFSLSPVLCLLYKVSVPCPPSALHTVLGLYSLSPSRLMSLFPVSLPLHKLCLTWSVPCLPYSFLCLLIPVNCPSVPCSVALFYCSCALFLCFPFSVPPSLVLCSSVSGPLFLCLLSSVLCQSCLSYCSTCENCGFFGEEGACRRKEWKNCIHRQKGVAKSLLTCARRNKLFNLFQLYLYHAQSLLLFSSG
jgi:hypothetical protein